MNCAVCSAPALPIDDACVFCHAPLVDHDEPVELLDYLAERIPVAQAKRGHLNRGPITELSIDLNGRSFRSAPASRTTCWSWRRRSSWPPGSTFY